MDFIEILLKSWRNDIIMEKWYNHGDNL
jgi:hypothetical protein